MANRTDSSADTVHGANPQYLVDRIIRNKIYNDAYWKEFCFGLTTESLVDRASELDYIGGTYGGRRRPAKFLCLFLKMLQIQPDDEVVLEYIKQPDLKYLRALGVAYYRIASRHVNIYTTLEPLFADYRKLRYRDMVGKLSILHMDEFVDLLFREKTVCDVTMPGIPKREILEATLDLPPRESVLEDDLEDLEDLDLEEQAEPEGETSEPREQRGSPSPDVAAAEARQDAASPQPARPSRSRSARRSESRKRRRKERAASRSGSASVPRERAREKDGKSRKEGKADREEQGENKADRKDKREKKDKKEKAVKDKGDRREEGRQDGKKEKKKGKDGDLSVEDWNQIRKEMGLKPLK